MENEEIMELFRSRGQGHLFEDWENRGGEEREKLIRDLKEIDPDEIDYFTTLLGREPEKNSIAPVEYISRSEGLSNSEAIVHGRKLISAGKTAFFRY